MKTRQVVRRLKAAGVEVIAGRGKGAHVLLRYKGRQTTLPVHSADLAPHFIRMICKQLGLDPETVL